MPIYKSDNLGLFTQVYSDPFLHLYHSQRVLLHPEKRVGKWGAGESLCVYGWSK